MLIIAPIAGSKQSAEVKWEKKCYGERYLSAFYDKSEVYMKERWTRVERSGTNPRDSLNIFGRHPHLSRIDRLWNEPGHCSLCDSSRRGGSQVLTFVLVPRPFYLKRNVPKLEQRYRPSPDSMIRIANRQWLHQIQYYWGRVYDWLLVSRCKRDPVRAGTGVSCM